MEFIKWRNYLGEGRIKEAFFKGAFTNTFTSIVFYTLFSFSLPSTPQFLSIFQVSSLKILNFFCLLSSPASVNIPDCPPIVPYSSPSFNYYSLVTWCTNRIRARIDCHYPSCWHCLHFGQSSLSAFPQAQSGWGGAKCLHPTPSPSAGSLCMQINQLSLLGYFAYSLLISW